MVEFEILSGAGGFELLRCQSNCRQFEKLECRWDATSLKTNVGSQAKMYIRPIQKDLPLVPEEDSGNQIKEQCSFCNNEFPINNLRKHVELCIEEGLTKASNEDTVRASYSWNTATHVVDNHLPQSYFSAVDEVINEVSKTHSH
ncbi:hypothetical protein DPMN_158963 [Dreissena polymorpha]|uniref:Uncharacterized protein n=1 Tax=Dreissena polymorpha TaxID=45954 RepID=A0A9D4EKT3_DREPO|nr:hypothetical protein DPMN_158963 [Dreissena polymorpha]